GYAAHGSPTRTGPRRRRTGLRRGRVLLGCRAGLVPACLGRGRLGGGRRGRVPGWLADRRRPGGAAVNATGTMKAADVTAAARENAARTVTPVPRMRETLPSLALREKLLQLVDKVRLRTSDALIKGLEIAAVPLNTVNDSDTRREIVMPTHRDLRLLVRAFSKARFNTIDQRNAVLAARRVLDAALATPWYSSLTIITKALAARYWAPFEDTDDLHAWGRALAVANPRSVAGMSDLYRLAIQGASPHGALT